MSALLFSAACQAEPTKLYEFEQEVENSDGDLIKNILHSLLWILLWWISGRYTAAYHKCPHWSPWSLRSRNYWVASTPILPLRFEWYNVDIYHGKYSLRRGAYVLHLDWFRWLDLSSPQFVQVSRLGAIWRRKRDYYPSWYSSHYSRSYHGDEWVVLDQIMVCWKNFCQWVCEIAGLQWIVFFLN